MEHMVETCPFVQILDAPVPQLGNQVLELLQKIVSSSSVEPVQVIDVPKIFPDRVPQRIVERRPPQTAEQLVEVPTDLGYVLAVVAKMFFSEQEIRRIVAAMQGWDEDTRGGLPGSRPGQGSTASGSRVVDNPVPQVRREGGGSVQGPARRAPD